jgi:hypothetical protein
VYDVPADWRALTLTKWQNTHGRPMHFASQSEWSDSDQKNHPLIIGRQMNLIFLCISYFVIPFMINSTTVPISNNGSFSDANSVAVCGDGVFAIHNFGPAPAVGTKSGIQCKHLCLFHLQAVFANLIARRSVFHRWSGKLAAGNSKWTVRRFGSSNYENARLPCVGWCWRRVW